MSESSDGAMRAAEEVRQRIIDSVVEYRDCAVCLRDNVATSDDARARLDWEILGYEQAIQAVRETSLLNIIDRETNYRALVEALEGVVSIYDKAPYSEFRDAVEAARDLLPTEGNGR